MKTLRLSEIEIPPNRQRREFDQSLLNELAESISGPAGLLHAPILRMQIDSAGKTHYVLVAGERRLRAIEQLFSLGGSFTHNGVRYDEATGIPFTFLSELSPLEIREAEYDENTKRVDLSWSERAAATAELAAIRAEQAKLAGQAPPSVIALTEEIDRSGGRRALGTGETVTRRELIVAPFLHDPDVAAAKNVHEAFKVVKRKEEAARNSALAERVGRVFTAESHTALCGDSLVWLAAASAEAFDVILTDPPYGMGADEFGDSGGAGGSRGEHDYADTAQVYFNVLNACAGELFRVAKAQAHLYWFCDIEWFLISRATLAAAGWRVHRTPLIWHKPTASRIPWPEHGPQRKWEMILYAVKGDRKVTKVGFPDLITCPPDAQLDHAAQKPVGLYIDLLRRSVRPGDSVLDPFAGTGTIFPAAHELKCYATGIEKDPTHYAKGVKRLEALKAQGELAI